MLSLRSCVFHCTRNPFPTHKSNDYHIVEVMNVLGILMSGLESNTFITVIELIHFFSYVKFLKVKFQYIRLGGKPVNYYREC